MTPDSPGFDTHGLVTPLIICGGNGTRLWPISRTQSPKQFQRLGDATSPTFFQSAVLRHRGEGYGKPVIVSSIKHRATIAAQLADIGVEATVIHEPVGKNTGPAVLAAALAVMAQDRDGIMVVVPADHVIEGDLNRTVMAMRAAARSGRIITFGIKPRYAETGFGYITDGGPVVDYPGLHDVDRFVEKPPARKARQLVESERAYWASGLSMFSARTIITEYQKFDPETVAAVAHALAAGTRAEDGIELDPTHFARATSAPTESMVFEKTKCIALARLDVDWSDVGSWTAMHGISKADDQGNVLQGDVIAVETTNSMVRATSRLVTVVGMKDVIVIDTDDALLVTQVGHCQSVKKVAEHLKGEGRAEAEVHRPRPVTPALSRTLVTPIMQTRAVQMLSVCLAPKDGHDVDGVPHREVVVAHGTVRIETAAATWTLRDGERQALPPFLPARLVNETDAEAVVVLMAMTVAADDVVEPLARHG
jgi:mannose-1-phosphate guanylyltransferase/mannose-6-phosphate isomerase